MTIKYTPCQIKFDSKKIKRTQNGYLIVDAFVAKVGIVSRVDPTTGETRNELVSEKSLFSEESMNSLMGIPVTQFHPTLNGQRILLNTQTTGIFQKGFSIGQPEKVKTDGETYLKVPLMITDEQVIQDVLNGITPEVSLGYVSKDIPQEGIFKNKKFNYVQEQRINNHIALESNSMNRSGSDVRVKTDSKDFIYYENSKSEEKIMDLVTMKCDSKDVEVTEVAKVHLENKFKTDSQTINDLKKTNKELQEKYDSLKGETEEKDLLIQELSSYKLQADKQKTEQLQKTVKPILGSDYKFDGKSILEIKKDVIKKIRPDVNLEDASEGYVNGRFDTIIEGSKFDSNDKQASEVKNFAQQLQQKTDSQAKKENDPFGLDAILA